ncbi:tRNA-Thr(GGU) m(6)t(6)A37 methyltransferase TsaA [Ancylomarina subtilis]|uniref:tRNA-Thr(GGU) m(6)t(6)A37 methyltransferase TsaA n=1 Tax=Ancylomarina subtilis TaxID=1639035 RepID=A0A4Q7VJY2_9BACT|nr:tRNA (N6-threonylcarbamoyladenosine(37)-N6)-methyltransferase TrmO [Ancylomarina subtilis]RZT96377.1 tRNA-Thr(GGU) m(6)t(6)A37 methyltransferase TsaA [Ancylomarina subtilis]
MSIIIEPIGIIHTPFKTKEGMPIQSKGAKGIKGQIKLKDELVPGLTDLDGFSHVILIYNFHKSKGFDLLATPFLDNHQRGIFATRAPQRPNSIGISVVRLLKIENNILDIENVDMLDGTPLLDIKPYIPDFDIHKTEKNGWTENKTDNLNETKSDSRFE